MATCRVLPSADNNIFATSLGSPCCSEFIPSGLKKSVIDTFAVSHLAVVISNGLLSKFFLSVPRNP